MIEVKIFLDEEDTYEHKKLYEYIMRYLMHNNIRGASVFQAFAGFGYKHHLHQPKGIGTTDENPLMIMFIDENEKVKNVLPHIKELIKEGIIIKENVEMA